MARGVVVEFDAAFGERLHQIDSAARRIHLASRYDVGRTCLGAESAMDAVEQQVVVANVANRIRSVRPARPSDSSDEASGIEDPGRIEGRLEPPHERERAVVGSVEKFQRLTNSGRGREQSKITARRMRGFAPSRDGFCRDFGVSVFDGDNLRDAGAGVRAKFRFIAAGSSARARSAGGTAICADKGIE